MLCCDVLSVVIACVHTHALHPARDLVLVPELDGGHVYMHTCTHAHMHTRTHASVHECLLLSRRCSTTSCMSSPTQIRFWVFLSFQLCFALRNEAMHGVTAASDAPGDKCSFASCFGILLRRRGLACKPQPKERGKQTWTKLSKTRNHMLSNLSS